MSHTKNPPAMASHRDSEFPSRVANSPNAVIPGFESTFTTTLDVLASIPVPSSASTSSMDDVDVPSREVGMTCGDSGFSEMELTSPGSEVIYQDDNRCFSSMEVHEEDEENDDNDDDEVSSTISELSGMSEMSGQDWKPSASAGPMSWLQRQMHMGANPRQVLAKLFPEETALHFVRPDANDITLWKLIVNLLAEISWRKKLPDVNTLSDVVSLIRRSNKILVLTGAGVSVSCGIPDFRSPQGVYARLARDFPDLPDPHAMFDIRYFNRDPRPFYKFAREIYPGQFKPSACHKFIRALETHGKLLRNYTQNIDTLEQVAGIERAVQCHGSFATATCTNCKRKVGADEIREDILSQRIPVCTVCVPEGSERALEAPEAYSGIVARGVMKPDIVFFGEGLPEDFHKAMAVDRDQADLLLIIGSSLKVQPVALIPSSVPASVPQVLINREPLHDCRVDVELLGDADILVDHLCRALGDDWDELCWREAPLVPTETLIPEETVYASKTIDAEPSPTANRKRTADDASPTEPEIKRPRTEQDIDIATTEDKKRPRTEEDYSEVEMKRPRTEEDSSEVEMKRPRTEQDDSEVEMKRARTELDDSEVEMKRPRTEQDDDVEACTSSGSRARMTIGEKVDADADAESEWRGDARHFKLRQMSSDSTRDSGIAEPPEDRPPLSLSERLPDNTFYFVPPNRYVFPGAEVYPSNVSRTRRRASLPSSSDLDSSSSATSTEPELEPSLETLPESQPEP